MSQNDALRPRFHGSSPSIAREDVSSSDRSFSTCFHCVLQRILSVAPVRRIHPSTFLQLDVTYLFSAPGWSVFYAPGLAKTPPWLQCDSPALRLPRSTSPSWSPLLSSSILPHLASSVVLPLLTSPTTPPRIALPAILPHTASLGVPLGPASSVAPPFPVPSVVPIPLPLSAPPFMGNQYHIPASIKQHIFTQSAFDPQNIIAERFGVSTRTVHRITKSFRNYGTVSPQPAAIGRPRKLSWDDTIVC